MNYSEGQLAEEPKATEESDYTFRPQRLFFFQVNVPYSLSWIFYTLTLQDSIGSLDRFDIKGE